MPPDEELRLTAPAQHVQPSIGPEAWCPPVLYSAASSSRAVHPLSKPVRKQIPTMVLAAWVPGKGCAAASAVRAGEVISVRSAHLGRGSCGVLTGWHLLPPEHLVHVPSLSRAKRTLQALQPALTCLVQSKATTMNKSLCGLLLRPQKWHCGQL